MSLVTTELWNARRWSAEEPRLAADGRPELACTLWGLPVRKRLLTAVAAHQAIDGGRRFDLSADARLEWTHAADLAPFETEPGELAHLAEGGAHVSCLRLTRLPETCVWQHALEYPAGTQFLHQPALTAHELAEGCVRPPAVVGSYAVRAPDDGRKVAHIPRPVAVDARGERVWGSIEIAAGLSTVRFDRAALRNRLRWGDDGIVIYGLDTFGYTSVGGSYDSNVPNLCNAHGPFTLSADGTVTEIRAYVRCYVTRKFEFGIYNDNATDPHGLEGDSEETERVAADWWGPEWVASPSVSIALTAGVYWLAFNCDGVQNHYYDAGSGKRETQGNTFGTAWPDPHAGYDNGTSRDWSIYAVYTPSVTGNPWWLYQHASLGVQ